MSFQNVFYNNGLLSEILSFEPNLAVCATEKTTEKSFEKNIHNCTALEFEKFQNILISSGLLDKSDKISVKEQISKMAPLAVSKMASLEELDKTNVIVKSVAKKIINLKQIKFSDYWFAHPHKNSEIFPVFKAVQEIFQKENSYFSKQLALDVVVTILNDFGRYKRNDELGLLFDELIKNNIYNALYVANKLNIKEENEEKYKIKVAKEFINRNQCEKGIEIISSLTGTHKSNFEIGQIALSLVQKGFIKEAEAILIRFKDNEYLSVDMDDKKEDIRHIKYSIETENFYKIIEELVKQQKIDDAIRIIAAKEPKTQSLCKQVVDELIKEEKTDEALNFIKKGSQAKCINSDLPVWNKPYSLLILSLFSEHKPDDTNKAVSEFIARLSLKESTFWGMKIDNGNLFLCEFFDSFWKLNNNSNYFRLKDRLSKNDIDLRYILFRVILTDPSISARLSTSLSNLSMNSLKEDLQFAYQIAELIPNKSIRQPLLEIIKKTSGQNLIRESYFYERQYTRAINELIKQEKFDEAVEMINQLIRDEYVKHTSTISWFTIISNLILRNTEDSLKKSIELMKAHFIDKDGNITQESNDDFSCIAFELSQKENIAEILSKIKSTDSSTDKIMTKLCDKLSERIPHYKGEKEAQAAYDIAELIPDQAVREARLTSWKDTNKLYNYKIKTKNEPATIDLKPTTIDLKAEPLKTKGQIRSLTPSRLKCGASFVKDLWQKSLIFKIFSIFTAGIVPLIAFLYGCIVRRKFKTSYAAQQPTLPK